MPETPHQQFEYPPKAYPAWFRNGAIIDADGTDIEQEYDGIVDWLQQLEVSVTGQVETYADLPDPDPDIENERTGDRRVYLVADEAILYRDSGESWDPVGSGQFEVEDNGTPLGDATTLDLRNQLEVSVNTSGDNGATANINVSEPFEPEVLNVGVELNIPKYDETANADTTEGASNIIYISGSGSDASGLYYYDGSAWNRLEAGSSGAGALSELSIDTNKNWQSYDITNAGTVNADTVTADSAMNVPVYDGSDPSNGTFWIRSDR